MAAIKIFNKTFYYKSLLHIFIIDFYKKL